MDLIDDNSSLPNETFWNFSFTYGFSNASRHTVEDDLYEVPPVVIGLLSCCYGLISLAAVIGNLCVLLIVGTSRRMRTVTNYFIANLAVADIIIGLFSIPFQFQAALLQKWVLPDFMCAFCPFVQVLSVNVSIITLTAIAFDRYRAVMHPLKARTSKLSAKVIIFAIWIFSATVSVPYAVALRVTLVFDPKTGEDTKPFCHNVQISPFVWKIYNHILVTLQYFLPLCLITVVYIAIGQKLWRTKTPGNIQDDRDANIIKNRAKIGGFSLVTNDFALETFGTAVTSFGYSFGVFFPYRIIDGRIFPFRLISLISLYYIKIIKMLSIVVLLFALCWLPFQMYNILQEIFPEINSYKYINVIWFCCHWLAMSNSCYNPFIYAIYNERFNTEFHNKLRCCLNIFRSSSINNKCTDSSMSSRYG